MQPDSSSALYVEVLAEHNKAVTLLCHAIGITTIHNTVGNSVGSGGRVHPDGETMLDGALVSALVQTTKGKKLLSRAMVYLTPGQRCGHPRQ